MITLCIDWTFFLSVTTDRKCEKLIEKIHQSLHLPLQQTTAERYWKDEHLYRVIGSSSIEVPTATDGFYAVMKAVGGLASRWTVNSPMESGVWEFAGDAGPNDIRIPGVKFASFSTIGNQKQAEGAVALHVGSLSEPPSVEIR